ncbi:rCG55139, partial [Rattus norvegicus]
MSCLSPGRQRQGSSPKWEGKIKQLLGLDPGLRRLWKPVSFICVHIGDGAYQGAAESLLF